MIQKLNNLKSAEWNIAVSRDNTEININIGLHPKDVDRMHEAIETFLASCEDTKRHIKNFNEEFFSDQGTP